jgi:hypothetical protein
MNYTCQFKLKEQKQPSLWERVLGWWQQAGPKTSEPVQQVPKSGTNTDILLSQTQALTLKDAVESPNLQRESDTSHLRRNEAGQENPQLII